MEQEMNLPPKRDLKMVAAWITLCLTIVLLVFGAGVSYSQLDLHVNDTDIHLDSADVYTQIEDSIERHEHHAWQIGDERHKDILRRLERIEEKLDQ